ncbi:uncharacterized protein conserved in bacteria [Microbacterium testaceum StLB037]|uniref:Probable inorganic carbon transporter subunit DabA n=1 Tax=Microbacterium testaceum (strain StLB037) TaxID=979556 RepID=E8N7U0_MICTS|nr:DUF2309 domain-containing protein [Microbacterium testaceum]BAJ74346.1 uncharacterized protein conserved in bacteria [Microbacterium testaceum StLB037]
MTTTAPPSPATIRGWVAAAGRAIAPHFPLETFIARNPVAGYEDLDWEDALAEVARDHGILLSLPEERFRELHAQGRISSDDLLAALHVTVADARATTVLSLGRVMATVGDVLRQDLLVSPPMSPGSSLPTPASALSPRVHARVDDLTARWLTATLGTGAWAGPVRRDGMWTGWRRLAAVDPTLSRRVRSGIRSTPANAASAIAVALERWQLEGSAAEDFLRAHVLAQPGWSALVRHLTDGSREIDLTSLVAIRVTLERLLLPADASLPAPAQIAPDEKARIGAVALALGADPSDPATRAAVGRTLALVTPATRLTVWQEAFERGAARELAPRPVPASPTVSRPLAQAVFCIDTRSESFRRHLEAAGPVETLGFAGFFAVPISFRPADGSGEIASCPVLLTPRVAITESSVERDALARWRRHRIADGERDATLDALKESPVTPFAFAETAGWVIGAASAIRTLAPEGWRALVERVRPTKPSTHVDADVVFSLDERVLYAETALRMMGLVDDFAPIVLLCGHGATVTNNPFASSLQCGACGGHEGEPNARAAAMIFNDPETRRALAARGIRIPADTLFLAAQMDTVTDEVTLLEPWAVPATHETAVLELGQYLEAARAADAADRSASLPGGSDAAGAVRDTERRAADWAESYAEWGLAGNAAFIVGPRAITAGHDLGRRAFLHSYEAAADPDGSGLETILTAPMIVAQWINSQYAASTVAPDRFGAGPKPLHNVVGTVGVLSGYGGDVRLGLPWQSVGVGQEARHEPVRLQVFVQAPLARVNDIVDSSEVVRTLVANRWITLRVRDHETAPWMRWAAYGWQLDDLDAAAAPGIPALHPETTTKESHS